MGRIIGRFLFFIFQIFHYPMYRYAVIGLVNNDLLIRIQSIYLLFYKYLLSRKRKKEKKEVHKRDVLRVGFLAPFCCNSSFTPKLLFDAPNSIELFVYDMEHNNAIADFLGDRFNYKPFKTTIPERNKFKRIFADVFDYDKLARIINDDLLDVFIFVTGSIDLTLIKLIEETNANMFIAANTGSVVFPHKKVKKQLQIQLSPGYEIRDKRLFSFRKKDFIFSGSFYDNVFPYDNRNIETQKILNKNKKMFINARLSKFSDGYLKAVALLLKNDKERMFYFMGKEKEYLPKIKEYFKQKGVLSQVEYLGEFFTKKNSKGIIEDEGWEKCVKYLKDSRLVLDTFPEDGGSSKIEAFLSYTPVVSMGFKKGDYINNSQNHYIKQLEIAELSAKNIGDYVLIAEDIFNDKIDIEKVCEKQLDVGKQLTDNKIYWQKIMDVIYDK